MNKFDVLFLCNQNTKKFDIINYVNLLPIQLGNNELTTGYDSFEHAKEELGKRGHRLVGGAVLDHEYFGKCKQAVLYYVLRNR